MILAELRVVADRDIQGAAYDLRNLVDRASLDREAWQSTRWEVARLRASVSRRMLDLVAERLALLRPEDVPLNHLPTSSKLATAVADGGGARNDNEGARREDERMEDIIRDPEARRLALELDERMGELRKCRVGEISLRH